MWQNWEIGCDTMRYAASLYYYMVYNETSYAATNGHHSYFYLACGVRTLIWPIPYSHHRKQEFVHILCCVALFSSMFFRDELK